MSVLLYSTINKYNENYNNIENKINILKNKLDIEERRTNNIREIIENHLKTENDIYTIKKGLRLIDMFNNHVKLINFYYEIVVNVKKKKSEYTSKIDNIKREMEWLKKSKKDIDNLYDNMKIIIELIKDDEYDYENKLNFVEISINSMEKKNLKILS